MSDTKALTIVPRTLGEVTSMAEVFAKSGLLPEQLRGKVPDVVVQIMAGQELGLAPMAAIRGVHIVSGKPILSADTMVALALGSGLCEYFSCVEETATSVTYETKRKGNPNAQRVSWSDEDTKTAGLNLKDNWRMHKKQMRRARAKAILARDVYPDVLAGCYDPDEIQAPAREQERAPVAAPDIVDAEEVQPSDALISKIDEAGTVGELEALVPQLAALTNGRKAEARLRYNARKSELLKTSKPDPAASFEPPVAQDIGKTIQEPSPDIRPEPAP